ncbi:MAG: 5-formyltetrahydrofolate cyclo-ligase [Balneolaceae bacterium]|nr:5-formyltetrahydrofolate cyclo-ligase [Balneolaceae bacterium]
MSYSPDRKEEIRHNFLKKRQNLSSQEVEKKSEQIIKQLLRLKTFRDANVIHSYVSIEKNREVNTKKFIQSSLDMGKQVVVPKIAGEGELQHFKINSLDELRENSLGVPEPSGGREIPIRDLDLIIVPMVAGDLNKNRIGYGAGYYDRFLQNCTAAKVGLLYDCQLYADSLPVEEFDIPLDILITESREIK